jgi:hypothetical protein
MFFFERELGIDEAVEALGWGSLPVGCTAYEVELDDDKGRLHRGDIRLLDCNASTILEFEQSANRYWREEKTPGGLYELLYEGPVVFTEVLKAASTQKDAAG